MSLLLALAFAAQDQPLWFRVRPARPCTVATAEIVTFERVRREPARLQHRCIAVRGVWSNSALYQDEVPASRPGAAFDEATIHQRIGLYGNAAVERGSHPPEAYVVAGFLFDCDIFEGQDIGGYCHPNLTGPFLAVTDMRRRRL